MGREPDHQMCQSTAGELRGFNLSSMEELEVAEEVLRRAVVLRGAAGQEVGPQPGADGTPGPGSGERGWIGSRACWISD